MKNYTLEKHLKSLAQEDHDYDLLASIWELNKANLSDGLSTIKSIYPHFSDHGLSHTNKIIDKIQCFLGENRIKELGATDTFLLLMAGLTHDIGMILTYAMIEEEWASLDFKKKISTLSQSDDSVIAEAAKLIINYNKTRQQEDSLIWALKVKNAVTLLTAEVFRSRHSQLSAAHISDKDDFYKLASGFHAEKLPKRFMDLLANIAYLHGAPSSEILELLYQKADGWKGDFIHPRFIACMIRLGDLLDFDSNRFDEYSLSTIEKIPETSVLHKEKHSSVKHVLISSNAIEAELNCQSDSVYRVARKWFDWLEDEVSFQSREWSNIAPEDLSGLPPMISKGSIRILYNGLKVSPELMNLRFTMSQEKIFNILRGGGIYRNPGFVFIREVVQNAFDASNAQLCDDIRMGVHSFLLGGKNLEELSFPDEIPSEIYNQYPVTLEVQWKDKEKSAILVICEDKGTGISESDLLHMTQKVGESKQHKTKDDTPYWLRPTGIFGIGLQSIFFVSDFFIVETKCIGEPAKRIKFKSAEHGQYSTIMGYDIQRERGTKVIVEIDRNKFEDLFNTNISWEIRHHIDFVLDNDDRKYISMIDAFVTSTFNENGTNHLSYKSDNTCKIINTNVKRFPQFDKKYTSNNSKYKIFCESNKKQLKFHVLENIYGSSLVITFNDKYQLYRYHYNFSLMIRSVMVKNAHRMVSESEFAQITWDLYKDDSDRLVDISRDNLTLQGGAFLSKLLQKEILPMVLPEFQKEFKKEIKKESEDNTLIEIQYAHYIMLCMEIGCKIENDNLTQKIKLPTSFCTINGTQQVSIQQITNAEKIVYLYDTEEKKTSGKIKTLVGNQIVIKDPVLRQAKTRNMTLKKMEFITDNKRLLFYEKSQSDTDLDGIVDCSNITAFHKMIAPDDVICENKRETYLAVSEYKDIAIRKEGGRQICIVSPFTDQFVFTQYNADVIGNNIESVRTYVDNHMQEFITDNLLDYVLAHHINKDITKDLVRKCYKRFVSNHLFVTNGGFVESTNEVTE